MKRKNIEDCLICMVYNDILKTRGTKLAIFALQLELDKLQELIEAADISWAQEVKYLGIILKLSLI